MALAERYKSLADEIEAEIYKGVFREKLPGRLQLSARYNVAPKTVAKAVDLLGKRGLVTTRVREGTYITRMDNGRPKHMTLGLIGFPLDAEPSLSQFKLLHEIAVKRDYDLISLQFTRAKLLEKPNLLVGLPVDGFLFDNSTISPEVILMLRRASIPFVTLNMITSVSGVCWIDFDAEDMVRCGLEYLLNRGHRKIAIVGFRSSIEEHHSLIRDTYIRVMRAHKEYRPEFFMMEKAFPKFYQMENHAEVYHRALKEFAQVAVEEIMGFAEADRPTALYVMGSEIANDMREELEKRNLSVPRDISVITTHTSLLRSEEFFTHIRFDMNVRSCMGLELLLELVEGKVVKPIQKTIPGTLVERSSVEGL